MTDTSHQMIKDRETLPERVELARKPTGIILVYLPYNSSTPFVTWQEGQDRATFWGHYHRDIRAAVEDFESR